MKRITVIIVMAVFALAFLGASAATASEDTWYEGQIKAGATAALQGRLHTDDSGSKGGLEYNAEIGKRWTGVFGGNLRLDTDLVDMRFDGLYRDVNDQDYAGDLSIARVVVFKTDYSRLYHRLGHDDLGNLEAHVFRDGNGHGQVPRTGTDPATGITYDTGGRNTIGTAAVYHTDLDPTNQYAIQRSLLKNSVAFHIPQIPEFGLTFLNRYEQREGDQQAMTNSKCRACHIVSNTKWVDETTNELGPKLDLRIGTMAVEYSYMYREFKTDSDDMNMLYNNTIGPPTLGGDREDFRNRVQYNGSTGALPYAQVPENRRDKHNAKFRWDINGHNTLNAYYLYSNNQNISTRGAYDILTGNYNDELKLKDNTFGGKITSHITHGLTVNLFGKYQALDNTNVNIEKIQLRNSYTAGGGDTMTLAEGYIAHGADPAHVHEYIEPAYDRVSGYDSNNFKVGINAAWRVLRNLKLKGEYEYSRENRDHYDVHNVPESTKEHIVKLAADYHFSHALKFALDTKMEFMDDAYKLVNAACTPNSTYGDYGWKTGNTAAPANQYDIHRAYEPAIYGKRTADRSNQPDQVYELKFKTYWNALSMLNTNMHVKYRYAQNSDIDGRDWNQNFVMAGLNFMSSPIKNLTMSGGYTYMYDSYDSEYCIALYDG